MLPLKLLKSQEHYLTSILKYKLFQLKQQKLMDNTAYL